MHLCVSGYFYLKLSFEKAKNQPKKNEADTVFFTFAESFYRLNDDVEKLSVQPTVSNSSVIYPFLTPPLMPLTFQPNASKGGLDKTSRFSPGMRLILVTKRLMCSYLPLSSSEKA